MKLNNKNMDILNTVKDNVTPKPNIITQHMGDIKGLAYDCKIIQYIRSIEEVYVVDIVNLSYACGERDTKDMLASRNTSYNSTNVSEFCLITLHCMTIDEITSPDIIAEHNRNYDETNAIDIDNELTDDNIINLAYSLSQYTNRCVTDSTIIRGQNTIIAYVKDNVYDGSVIDSDITQYLKY